MPIAADAIAALDPARVAAAVRGAGDIDDAPSSDDEGRNHGDGDGGGGGGIGITVAGREHVLSADDVILTMRAPEGYSVEREGAHAVALDLAIDDDLREEGYAREIVHAVQNARKAAGLVVEDRIELALGGDPALVRAGEVHRDYLAGETLAVKLELGDGSTADPAAADYSEQANVDGKELKIVLRQATRG
jgi:isoleucyl-tRNA synthetase